MRRRFLVWLHCRHSDSPWQLQVLVVMDPVVLMDLMFLEDLIILDLMALKLLVVPYGSGGSDVVTHFLSSPSSKHFYDILKIKYSFIQKY